MSLSEYQTIDVQTTQRVATIAFNRPDKVNAMSGELQNEVIDALSQLAAEDAVRAVVLTGNGRAFSAGYDLDEAPPADVMQLRRSTSQPDRYAHAVWSFPKPIVAAVHGYCLAGACEIAMLCDVTVAAEGCRFGEPEVRFGSGSTLVMPWLVPMKVAKELLMGGSLISAQRAYEIGMVNHVVSEDDLLPTAHKLAQMFAAMAPASVQYTKQGINAAYEAAGMWSAIAHHTELVTLMTLAKSEEKDTFDEIAARDGVRAALTWRDKQFARFDN